MKSKLRLLIGCIVIASVMNIICSEGKLKEYPVFLIPDKASENRAWEEKVLSIVDMLENINQCDSKRYLPLHDAVAHGASTEYVRELLKRGLAIDSKALSTIFRETHMLHAITDPNKLFVHSAQHQEISMATLDLCLHYATQGDVEKFLEDIKESYDGLTQTGKTQADTVLNGMYLALR